MSAKVEVRTQCPPKKRQLQILGDAQAAPFFFLACIGQFRGLECCIALCGVFSSFCRVVSFVVFGLCCFVAFGCSFRYGLCSCF